MIEAARLGLPRLPTGEAGLRERGPGEVLAETLDALAPSTPPLRRAEGPIKKFHIRIENEDLLRAVVETLITWRNGVSFKLKSSTAFSKLGSDEAHLDLIDEDRNLRLYIEKPDSKIQRAELAEGLPRVIESLKPPLEAASVPVDKFEAIVQRKLGIDKARERRVSSTARTGTLKTYTNDS